MKKSRRKIILASILGVFMLVSLAGCQSKKVDLTEEKPQRATLVIKKDGTYQAGVTSSFEEDYYSVDKLTEYVRGQIKEYQDKHSGADIQLTQVAEDNKTAAVIFTFTSLDDYSGFCDVNTFMGNVQQASSIEGWGTNFIAAKGGSSVSAADLNSSDRVIMVTPNVETTDVRIEGKILYVSGGIILDSHTVQIETGITGCIVYK